jgi:hypothetical protein
MGARVPMAEDVRRRRAERVKQDKLKNFIPLYGRYIAIAVVLIVAGAAVAMFYHPPAAKSFVHKHAAFAIYVNGQEFSFADPAYDHQQIGGTAHFHFNEAGGGHIFHIEGSFPGGNPDIPLPLLFEPYNVMISQGYLKEDTRIPSHNGSEWRDAGNSTWKLYVSKLGASAREDFVQVQDYLSYKPQEHDKFLFTYGNPSPADLAAQERSIPDPPGEGQPGVMPT